MKKKISFDVHNISFVRLLPWVATIGLAGCQRDGLTTSQNSSSGAEDSADTVDPTAESMSGQVPTGGDEADDSAVEGTGPDPGTDLPDSCDGVWMPGPLPTPWWVEDPPASCAETLAHDTPEAYDDCTTSPHSPSECGIPTAGAVVCEGSNDDTSGRLTVTCESDADCPESMLCVGPAGPGGGNPGSMFCEKQCSGTGDAECIRCNMECNVDWGVCLARQPVGRECEADCQCETWCDNGHCAIAPGPPRRGICGDGPDIDCACVGGECEAGCCYLGDGSIAGPTDPECTG